MNNQCGILNCAKLENNEEFECESGFRNPIEGTIFVSRKHNGLFDMSDLLKFK